MISALLNTQHAIRNTLPALLTVIFLLLLALVCFFGCDHKAKEGTLTISDVTQPQLFDLTLTNRNMLEISWIKLHIEGQLDGTAYVVPQMAETQKVSGAVNLEWGGDVSATKYILEYLPGDVKGGTLTIKYVLN